MPESFHVEVLTPEGEVFNDDVEMISTRTTVGSIGILARHQPLLGMLDPTELRLYKTYGDESSATRFAQGEGYVQVTGEHVLILVEDAVASEPHGAGPPLGGRVGESGPGQLAGERLEVREPGTIDRRVGREPLGEPEVIHAGGVDGEDDEPSVRAQHAPHLRKGSVAIHEMHRGL